MGLYFDCFDWQGKRITLDEWCELNKKPRHVAQTELGELGYVSTVWLGMNHNFSGSGYPPIIFETMVFGGPLDQAQERYCTLEEAAEGHQFFVMRLTSLADLEEVHPEHTDARHPGALPDADQQ
jgi:hypothetical protein